MRVADCISSRSNPNRLGSKPDVRMARPVALPRGRLKLSTRPYSIGSPPMLNIIGIVLVTDLTASAVGVPPVATKTATGRLVSSSGNAGRRSY